MKFTSKITKGSGHVNLPNGCASFSWGVMEKIKHNFPNENEIKVDISFGNQADYLFNSDTMYVIYARQIGSEEWISQQSTESLEMASQYLEFNRRYNDETYEKGTGREYILVKRVSTFEIVK